MYDFQVISLSPVGSTDAFNELSAALPPCSSMTSRCDAGSGAALFSARLISWGHGLLWGFIGFMVIFIGIDGIYGDFLWDLW